MHKILDPWAMAHHHIIIEITFCTASCQAQGCQINPRGASNTSSVPASLKRGAEKKILIIILVLKFLTFIKNNTRLLVSFELAD